MENANENRTKCIRVRLKPIEEETLSRRFKQSTFQNLSEYGRALLLGKPVTVTHRNKSMDELLEELVLLRRELNAIGNNLNQAVRHINSAHGQAVPEDWMKLLMLVNGKLLPSISEIKSRMEQYADLWWQELKVEKA